MFIVHNELEDGWMWVTNLRTDEQGLIVEDLVEEVVSVVLFFSFSEFYFFFFCKIVKHVYNQGNCEYIFIYEMPYFTSTRNFLLKCTHY